MPKFIIRIVSLLLIPCLLDNPSFAFAFALPQQQASTNSVTIFQQNRFQEQALMLAEGEILPAFTNAGKKQRHREAMEAETMRNLAARHLFPIAQANSTVAPNADFGIAQDHSIGLVSEEEHAEFHRVGKFEEIIGDLAQRIGAKRRPDGWWNLKEAVRQAGGRIVTEYGQIRLEPEDGMLVIIDKRFRKKGHAGPDEWAVYAVDEPTAQHEMYELRQWPKFAKHVHAVRSRFVPRLGGLATAIREWMNNRSVGDSERFLRRLRVRFAGDQFHSEGLDVEDRLRASARVQVLERIYRSKLWSGTVLSQRMASEPQPGLASSMAAGKAGDILSISAETPCVYAVLWDKITRRAVVIQSHNSDFYAYAQITAEQAIQMLGLKPSDKTYLQANVVAMVFRSPANSLLRMQENLQSALEWVGVPELKPDVHLAWSLEYGVKFLPKEGLLLAVDPRDKNLHRYISLGDRPPLSAIRGMPQKPDLFISADGKANYAPEEDRQKRFDQDAAVFERVLHGPLTAEDFPQAIRTLQPHMIALHERLMETGYRNFHLPSDFLASTADLFFDDESKEDSLHMVKILFQSFLIDYLSLLAVRAGDGGPSNEAANVATVQRLLAEVESLRMPRVVSDVSQLVSFPGSVLSPNELEQVNHQKAFIRIFRGEQGPPQHSRRFVQEESRHLRGLIMQKRIEPRAKHPMFWPEIERTRAANSVDYATTILNLIPLLEYYDRFGNEDGLAIDIAAGLSGDPEMFLNPTMLVTLNPQHSRQLFKDYTPEQLESFMPGAFYPEHLGRPTLEHYFSLINRVRGRLLTDLRKFQAEGPDSVASVFGNMDVYPNIALTQLWMTRLLAPEESESFLYEALSRPDASQRRTTWRQLLDKMGRRLKDQEPQDSELQAYINPFNRLVGLYSFEETLKGLESFVAPAAAPWTDLCKLFTIAVVGLGTGLSTLGILAHPSLIFSSSAPNNKSSFLSKRAA